MPLILKIHDNISIAFGTACTARTWFQDCLKNMHFLSATSYATEESSIYAKRVDQISRFVSSFNRVLRSNPSKTIVLCVGRDFPTSLTTAALLLGGFLILGRGMDVEHVTSSFQIVADRFISFGDKSDCARHTVQDCWLALHFARKLGWIDLSDEIKPGMDLLDFGSLDVDAYAHYAEAANGGIITVVPQKILFFPSPVDLPGNAEWMDSADGERHFSPAFYADLLATEFNVSTVMCVDSGCSSSSKAFADLGIAAEDMPLDDSVPDLLRALDRLLAVTQAGPGAVALHSRPGAAAAMGRAGALIAAYLTRRVGFPPRRRRRLGAHGPPVPPPPCPPSVAAPGPHGMRRQRVCTPAERVSGRHASDAGAGGGGRGGRHPSGCVFAISHIVGHVDARRRRPVLRRAAQRPGARTGLGESLLGRLCCAGGSEHQGLARVGLCIRRRQRLRHSVRLGMRDAMQGGGVAALLANSGACLVLTRCEPE
jgi:hypothetical protein